MFDMFDEILSYDETISIRKHYVEEIESSIGRILTKQELSIFNFAFNSGWLCMKNESDKLLRIIADENPSR